MSMLVKPTASIEVISSCRTQTFLKLRCPTHYVRTQYRRFFRMAPFDGYNGFCPLMGTRMVPAYQNKVYHAGDVQSTLDTCTTAFGKPVTTHVSSLCSSIEVIASFSVSPGKLHIEIHDGLVSKPRWQAIDDDAACQKANDGFRFWVISPRHRPRSF
jgi:hypothetical protein